MANRNTQGFGLIPAGTLGSTPATSGQGKYKIDAGYATTIYHGGAVASAAGYIVEGQGTDTPILGVLKRNILQRGYNFKADVCESLRSSNTSKLRRYRCICIR
jgi:hypothetical protein